MWAVLTRTRRLNDSPSLPSLAALVAAAGVLSPPEAPEF